LQSVIKELSNAKRPVIFAGSGIRISDTEAKLLELAEFLRHTRSDSLDARYFSK
jgi:thiamine pyrophosphate-dependent acetolactate synthase large subunit-like protein